MEESNLRYNSLCGILSKGTVREKTQSLIRENAVLGIYNNELNINIGKSLECTNTLDQIEIIESAVIEIKKKMNNPRQKYNQFIFPEKKDRAVMGANHEENPEKKQKDGVT